MQIYYGQVSLEEGFEILAQEKHNRLFKGKRVSTPSGYALYVAHHTQGLKMKCWECGLEASCFIAAKGRNDFISPPVLELFAQKGHEFVLMTRDHIIPKSYGGSNDLQNLRVGCGPCNSSRGNALDPHDIVFMRAHPELILPNATKLSLNPDATEVQKTVGGGIGKPPLTEEQRLEKRRLKRAAYKQRVRARRAHEKAAHESV